MAINGKNNYVIRKLSIKLPQGWTITHHQLFDISPDDVDQASAWYSYFVEDLLQIVNEDHGLLLDIGWYPDSDPGGHFRLVMLPKRSDESKRNSYDWKRPLINFQTRSLNELLQRIQLCCEEKN